MRSTCLFHRLAAVGLVVVAALPSVGCSTLGLSLYPTGSFLTDQAEAVVAATPTPAAIARERDKEVLSAHFLQPGDSVLVETVSDDAELRLPADQRVLADGTIDLGRYGRVVVAGSTLESAEELIEQTIRQVADRIGTGEGEELEDDALQINVRLIDDNHRYYVLGEVNSPGIYEMEGHETVLDGILEAGGLTDAASGCNIILARPTDPCGCRVTLPICYRQITQLGDTATNYQLRPGDRIFVASRTCCEELWFCKAGETCERCQPCQRPCAHPAAAVPVNPFGRVPNTPIVDSLPVPGQAFADPAAGDAAAEDIGNDGMIQDLPAPGSDANRSFPELLEDPGEAIDATPDAPANDGEFDGELNFDAPQRTGRRFAPIRLR